VKTLKTKLFLLRFILSVFILSSILFGCIPQKKLFYLQPTKSVDSTLYKIKTNPPDYKVQIKDYLFIRIISMNEEITKMLNLYGGENMNYNPQSVSLISYLVDDSGYISIPFIGKILVKGLSINEIIDILQEKVDNEFKGAKVIVKIVNYHFTVLGEVNLPNSFYVNKERVDIFEAIGTAGDMTIYGNRKNVKIIRNTPDGTRIITLDLTDKKILESPYFFLANNDILYVESMKSKSVNINTFKLSAFLGVIGTAVSLLLLAKLVK